MLQKQFLLFIFLFLSFLGFTQISTQPALPVASQGVIVTFDSSKESRLGYFTGDLYAHTGVNIDGKGNWQYVIGNWGDNTIQPKLTHIGNGIYELEIKPDVNTFYTVNAGEKVVQMAMVFRSADGKKQTNDLFINVNSLLVKILEPSVKSFLNLNQSVTISANSSQEASLKIYTNGNVWEQISDTEITANYTFNQSGTFWIFAEATTSVETARDSVQVYINDGVVTKAKPAAYKKGINYITGNSVALVFWAPLKDSVYVIGEFNDWQPTREYKMHKDNNYFWLEISNLEPGKEYAFQYFIDGKIKVADPYTEKILDPWNDRYISSDVYPNLISYPTGKTQGVTSVLQTGQEEFNWEITDFQTPNKEKLVIYELLVRDFMEDHTYKAVREKLDYLEDLRINVLELMPVNEFEGNDSWGYNPAFYFAPDKFYGPKDELKKLIDECHKRGIAVVIDMVLNHSYGQSPFVQMYMNNWTVTTENPWYNVKSNFQNPAAQWGYDFNHETSATRELVDSVSSFWMSEYKVDGFRFDFTKGFSNTPYPADSWGSNFDVARISNLQRMSSEIWKRNEKAIVIFEHLADNSEETVLANNGILLWGNMHGNYQEAARGNVGGSNFTWAIYSERGWNNPNLVSYPESHDEERIMLTIKQNGYSNGDYNIKNQQTALDRIELNSLFHILLPGPKMIWQFGERGYDLSINRCENGSISYNCRLTPKPPYWHYLENPDRIDLFHVVAKLNELKQTYPEFSPESFSYDLTGAVKWYRLTNGENHVFAMGNFDVQQRTANITIPKTGKWYEFFTRDSIQVNTVNLSIPLAPGEYRLYSTQKFYDPRVITEIGEINSVKHNIQVYPNPAVNEINITSPNSISEIQIYSLTGKLMVQNNSISERSKRINVGGFVPGIYILKVIQKDKTSTVKFVKKKINV